MQGQIDHPEQVGLPPGVLFSVNEEAYVYEEEMTGVWQESVKEYMRQQRCVGEDGMHNSLLLLDDYKVHKSQAVKESLQSNGIYVQAIPGGLTPVAQPLDIFLNRLVKDYQKKCYEKWGLEQVVDEHGKIPYPTRPLMATWLRCAWDRITSKDIIRFFVKAGVSQPDDYPEQVQHDLSLKDLVPTYDIDV